ncbi:MAG: hypothetical protein HYX93_01955 [Chloroflexi bacterium]|nr:hypothetical protein [Chloroflexota bacterium]
MALDMFGTLSKRKCGECGFLALRDKFTLRLQEAERDFRKEPWYSETRHNARFGTSKKATDAVSILPLCFAQAIDMRAEIQKHTSEDIYKHNVKDAVQTMMDDPRQCSKFTKWQQGFTPKEHREMRDSERKDFHNRLQSYISIMIAFIAMVVAVYGIVNR